MMFEMGWFMIRLVANQFLQYSDFNTVWQQLRPSELQRIDAYWWLLKSLAIRNLIPMSYSSIDEKLSSGATPDIAPNE